jgi:hypothetical protein
MEITIMSRTAIPLFILLLTLDAFAEDIEIIKRQGIAALKESQKDSTKIVMAANCFSKAAKFYADAGNSEAAVEMNSFLYWCKKKMTMEDINKFHATAGKLDTTATITTEAPALPEDEAQAYFDRAERFARDNPNEPLLIAIRYFEVADRFKGTPISLEAQDRSLQAQQRSLAKKEEIPPVQLPNLKPATAGRQPLPDAAKLSAARRSVRDIFKSDFSSTASADNKAALPAKLLNLAIAEKADDVRYALFRESIDAAIRNGDATVACEALRRCGALYEIDTDTEILANLTQLSRGRLDTTQAKTIALEIQRAGNEVLDQDDYDSLQKYTTVAASLIPRLAGDKGAQVELQTWSKSLLDVSREWKLIARIVEKLKTSPEDPAANQAVGNFYTFVRGNFGRGLPALARGTDAELKALAIKELEIPTEDSQLITLADDWFSYGSKQRDSKKIQAFLRATTHYRAVLQRLSGLERKRIEMNLEEAQKVLAVTNGTAVETSTKTTGPKLRAGAKVRMDFFVKVDDSCEVYINGNPILTASHEVSGEKQVDVQLGDVIAVKVVDKGGVYSFSCVFKSKFGSMASSVSEWNSYTPHDPEKWWNVPAIKEAVVEADTELARNLKKQTDVDCQAIWPKGLRGRSTGYLTFQVKEDSLKQ